MFDIHMRFMEVFIMVIRRAMRSHHLRAQDVDIQNNGQFFELLFHQAQHYASANTAPGKLSNIVIREKIIEGFRAVLASLMSLSCFCSAL